MNEVLLMVSAPLEISAPIRRALDHIQNARTAAEIVEASIEVDKAIYAAKKMARTLQPRFAAAQHVLDEIHAAMAELLASQAAAKARLADEYDAAQKRGEVASQGKPSKAEGLATTADIGLTYKAVHEARQIRDALEVDPDIIKRTLDAKVEDGEAPTKSDIQRAVIEAAALGGNFPGSKKRSGGNPSFVPPSKAGAAWTHLYGACRALVEWSTDENLELARQGIAEREDSQAANIRAVRNCAGKLLSIVGEIDADETTHAFRVDGMGIRSKTGAQRAADRG